MKNTDLNIEVGHCLNYSNKLNIKDNNACLTAIDAADKKQLQNKLNEQYQDIKVTNTTQIIGSETKGAIENNRYNKELEMIINKYEKAKKIIQSQKKQIKLLRMTHKQSMDKIHSIIYKYFQAKFLN